MGKKYKIKDAFDKIFSLLAIESKKTDKCGVLKTVKHWPKYFGQMVISKSH